MTNKNQVNTRLVSLSILDEILKNDKLSHKVLNDTLNEYKDLSKQDRAFITRIVGGTLEHLLYLDYIINQFSKTKTNKMKITILNILRLSLYQIRFMDSIPESAACNEAVKLAKKRGFDKLSGFVNGVLRNIARQIDTIQLPDEKKEPFKYLSIAYSFPEWIIKLWLKEYDYSTVKSLCEASNAIPITSIRCNTTLISPDELKKELEALGITVEGGYYLPYAFRIKGYDRLEDLAPFQKGYFQVQDESSMLVGEVINPKDEALIVDVCSAPGGKATHLAEKLQNNGCVIARDLTDKKVVYIRENINRLMLENIKVETYDALSLDHSLLGQADVVLADLPCSGLGIIKKKPDIKYRIEQNQLKELIALQRQILSVVYQYLKPGGILIYSTCTIHKGENEENVKWLTEQLPLEIEDLTEYVPEELKESCKNGILQLLPHKHLTDGFFISRLRRK